VSKGRLSWWGTGYRANEDHFGCSRIQVRSVWVFLGKNYEVYHGSLKLIFWWKNILETVWISQ
jgi:hypothetical protein